jgi:SAM-dependent methyltransferase
MRIMEIANDHRQLHDREAGFHDRWAGGTALENIRVRQAFEAPTALENRFILGQMGDLKGKRVLDIGCGLGESSVYLALQGAEVTALDVSPGMVRTTCDLGAAWGVAIDGRVSPAENLAVESGLFDMVYVANTIHHVQDRARLFSEIGRVLKPGGSFYSFDPVAYNPAINIYRRMAMDVRTPDEQPLRTTDIALARSCFPNLQARFFWIAGLALFAKYYLLDRVHPNADRYWKRIFQETPGSLWWWRPLSRLDSILTRLPGIQYLAWNVVLWGNKP